ncbi:MAG: tRNA lysidine(34) synthetase TilS [Chlorobium sp.]|nr:MAG: tRNA lysidine(34) synthetase TilS [Chlorobium sp.]
MNPFEKKFLEQLRTRKLVQEKDRILCAVSGGPDSMAMLSLFIAVRPVLHCELAAAHCNFQLRGPESDADERFVADFCRTQGIACYVEHYDTRYAAAGMKKSIEETARVLRYRFFERLVDEKAFTKIATGHHVNDNAETLLFNLFRGVSLPGLTGIRAKNGRIIRPMLLFHKADIQAYLKEKGIDSCEDSSNVLEEYDRNFIRNRVIPLIEERFPHKLLPSLQRLSEQAGELEEFLELYFEDLAAREPGLSFCKGELDADALRRRTIFEQKEIFKRALRDIDATVDSRTLQKLAALLQSQPGKMVMAGKNVRVLWKGKKLLFTKQA